MKVPNVSYKCLVLAVKVQKLKLSMWVLIEQNCNFFVPPFLPTVNESEHPGKYGRSLRLAVLGSLYFMVSFQISELM